MDKIQVNAEWKHVYDMNDDFTHASLENEDGHTICYVSQPSPQRERYEWWAGGPFCNVAKGKTDDLDEAKEKAEEALEQWLEQVTGKIFIMNVG